MKSNLVIVVENGNVNRAIKILKDAWRQGPLRPDFNRHKSYESPGQRRRRRKKRSTLKCRRKWDRLEKAADKLHLQPRQPYLGRRR